MENNENTDPTKNVGETGGRKRTRIFGARKSQKKAEQAPVETTTEVTDAAQTAASDAAVEAPAAAESKAEPKAAEPRAAKAQAAPAVEKQSVEAPSADAQAADEAPTEAGDAAAEPQGEPAASVAPTLFPAALTTTSLIFHAPEIAALPPRPNRGGRPDRSERDDRDQDDDFEESESTVRRRARRRSGDESRGGSDDPTNTVVKVRTPRQPELITEPQRIKGSTRLEAKKQRRRDGRDAGRRRAVITEAEFLARRESVDRTMVVRSKSARIQIGVLEDGVLVEHYVARNQDASLIGNVYLGRVQNVLPSMEAAFVDIGRGRNAVLYSGEVDWEAAAAENPGGNQPRRIELALKPGDKVLVQVTKDPVGHKGARLTSQISLPGRYLVYVPNGSMNGISRKLPDTERARLKKILKEVLPDNQGVIVRTAAEGATEEQLTLDVNRLIEQWASISKQLETVQAPALLHSEPDLLIKIVRDVFNEDFQKMVIAGDEAQETIEAYLRAVAPDLVERVETYTGDKDAFDEFRISEQIEKALDRKVWLPSGGSLVIDRTEAMTVVDVNTGKFVGSGGNLEETVTKNNLEAAEEIVRQLRLRDIGGIIVVDFIDMVLESNRDLVLRRLVECLSRDRTKHQVAEVTSLGLVQMTRKKLGLGLLESFSENCEVCAGRGIIVHHDPVVRHRQQQQTPQPAIAGSGNRRRGGGQSAPSSQSAAPTDAAKSGNGTHGITEDAKHALAMIAASTLHPHEKEAAAAAVVSEPAEDQEQSTTEASSTEAASGDRKSSRRGRRGRHGKGEQANAEQANADQASGEQASAAQPKDEQTDGRSRSTDAAAEAEPEPAEQQSTRPAAEAPDAVAAAPSVSAASEAGNRPAEKRPASRRARQEKPVTTEAPVAILDIPVVAKVVREPKRVNPVEAEHLLDSVLDSLPQPKQAGQGRARSRRVTTAGLSTTPVEPIVTTGAGE
ncbi:Rne/Rng family ribonuclease [Leifsonia flava]|uniref:Rne/Rng family ribonuclease n=1 Tax=Orlajensenia leifsoniae TaxID=2561933 RepID=UPI001EFFDD57|nr:Rne/Rng family ribonuclease [Leifsonia flava]